MTTIATAHQVSSISRVATAMLKFGREGIDLEDLAVRVDALEKAAKEKGLDTCASRVAYN